MYGVNVVVQTSVAILLREIISKKPPLIYLNLHYFNFIEDDNNITFEIILEALLNSKISTIQNLNLGFNLTWTR